MGAINATLTFMVGCPDMSIYEKVEPLLKQLGKTIFHCGDVGNGQVAKVIWIKIWNRFRLLIIWY